MIRPGCRCPQCWTLREYMRELTGKDRPDLPAAPGCLPDTATLNVLTSGPPASNVLTFGIPTHDGTMTCRCDACAKERSARVRRGIRESDGGIPIKRRRAA